MTEIGIDFETASELDLKEVGATKYAAHPSTHVLCLGYGNQKSPLQNFWRPGQPFSRDLRYQAQTGHTFVAHNAQFDRQIWKHQLTAKLGIPLPNKWLCTATRASANGLPRGLDECCEALGFDGKDKEGSKALQRMMKPDKKTGIFIDTPELRKPMEFYCGVDLLRMWQIYEATKPLSAWEQRYYDLDQEINERGFAVDRGGVERILERLVEAYKELDVRVFDATDGELGNINSIDQLGAWFAKKGLKLANYQAQTLTDTLSRGDLTDQMRKVIHLRKLASAKSPSKFAAFKRRGEEDGDLLIMRDCFVVNGTHTGRHTSKGFQSQNMLRDCASEDEVDCLLNDPLDWMRLLYGEPLKIAGRSVRPMVRARHGKKLLIGDFSKVETCVLFALAGEKRGLQMLRDGVDLYKDLATKIFDKPLPMILPDERQLGKHGILGLGFGCGVNTFFEMCTQKFGIKIPYHLAETTVPIYRDTYQAVVKYWYALGNAVKAAINGTPQQLGPLKIIADTTQLVIVLPSGRKLRYRSPRVAEDGSIRYWQEDPKTHQWVEQYSWGGKFTENVVQAIANDLQREAALRMSDELFDIVLHSHDEIVAEDDETRLQRFGTIMELSEDTPSWIVKMGIPIKVDLKCAERYRKAA